MYCSNCGKKLVGNASFCSYCGTKINGENIEQDVADKFSEEIEDSGSLININPEPLNSKTDSKLKTTSNIKKYIYLGVITVIIFLAVVLVTKIEDSMQDAQDKVGVYLKGIEMFSDNPDEYDGAKICEECEKWLEETNPMFDGATKEEREQISNFVEEYSTIFNKIGESVTQEDIDFILNRDIVTQDGRDCMNSTFGEEAEQSIMYANNWKFRQFLCEDYFDDIEWTYDDNGDRTNIVKFSGKTKFVVGEVGTNFELYFDWNSEDESPLVYDMITQTENETTSFREGTKEQYANSEDLDSYVDLTASMMLTFFSIDSVDESAEQELYAQDADSSLNNAQSQEHISESIEAAGALFEEFLGDNDEVYFDDHYCSDGGIYIDKETPSELNNYANYSISGRGFSYIYDTDCIDYITADNTWIFCDSTDLSTYYYKITAESDEIYTIYYSEKYTGEPDSIADPCGIFYASEKEIFNLDWMYTD